jgi:hypothetical protein
VGIIILLLFVVVQVNAEGDTRLKMFWYMLNGRAMLIGGKKPDLVTPPAAIGATLTPTLPDGTCPAGFHVVLVSGGKHMCQKDEPGYIPQPGQPGGGPEPMALYPINNTYRTITGNQF